MVLTPEWLTAAAALITPVMVAVTALIGYLNNRQLAKVAALSAATHNLVNGQNTHLVASIADLSARVAIENPRDKNAQIASITAQTNLGDKRTEDAAGSVNPSHS